MIARFTAVALTMLAASVALADHCAAPVRVVQHQQHYAPTYHQQAYYPPHYVPVQISPDYYYSTAQYYQQHLQAEATAAKTVQLLVDALRLGQAIQIQQPQQQILAPQLLIQPQGKATPVNPQFAALVGGRCAKCHLGKDAKGGIDMTDLSVLLKGTRKRMLAAVCTSDMPPSPPELTHEEIALFRAYYRAAE